MSNTNFGRWSSYQIPPDSTGKEIATTAVLKVTYASGTIDFTRGDAVTGAASGLTGKVSAVDGTTTAGDIYVVVNFSSPADDFDVAEDIQVNAVTNAVVSSTVRMHAPTGTVVGANNPLNAQFVGPKGSAYIRFADGDQQIDAAGISRVSQATQIAQYWNRYDKNEDFQETVTGGGSTTHLPNESAVAMDVGTPSGDEVIWQSHLYHIYQMGYSQNVEMTIAVGDTGKSNVRRRWGYFDADNGAFFELNGTTLSVVRRSRATGSVVDTAVNQSLWNGDRLDGGGGIDNLSLMNIDVSTMLIYWIDYQWMGAGQLRFGVYDDQGDRITVHSVQNTNIRAEPWMTHPALPVRFEITNTSTAASPSRLKAVCCSVKTDGNLVEARSRKTVKWSIESATNSSVADTAFEPIISFRSKTTLNSIVNRKISIPELISVYVTNNPILFAIIRNPTTLTGASWGSVSTRSAAEFDDSATVISGGDQLVTWALDIGTHNLSLPSNFGLFSENLHVLGDGTVGDVFSFATKCLVSASTSGVTMFPTWIDVE